MEREREIGSSCLADYAACPRQICVCVRCQQGKIDAEMLNDIRCI